MANQEESQQKQTFSQEGQQFLEEELLQEVTGGGNIFASCCERSTAVVEPSSRPRPQLSDPFTMNHGSIRTPDGRLLAKSVIISEGHATPGQVKAGIKQADKNFANLRKDLNKQNWDWYKPNN